jgi:hypothetical protein
MIRQAISCDICGAEKRQTNHWFVAYAQAGELRVSAWNSTGRTRSGTKHLCGQTCLHKLVDEYIAGTMPGRVPANADAVERGDASSATDTSLTSRETSGKPLAPGAPLDTPVRPLQVVPAAVIIAPLRAVEETRVPAALPPLEDAPNYASRRWRAEAWERERERERCATVAARRKSS